MRQYMIILEEKKELDTIICNQCGKEIAVCEGVPGEDVLHVEKRWGYPSEKDSRLDSFDLCEDCYDRLTEGFKVKLGE